jgi:pimeloyl-ACP methyl ester carboxylesterase
VAAIGEAVERFATAPILVAHSMGGVSTSQYAEQRPSTIAGVVYVSAVVSADGASGVSTIAEAGPDSLATRRGVWRFSEDRTSATMDLTAAAEAFYGRCPPDVIEKALSRLCPEPAAPLTTPLRLGASFSSLPRIYTGALDDRTVPPALQQRLAERAGAAFQTIDADHSPFFSAVDELAAQLHDARSHLRSG